jgi:catechol 2,3-dioxygenase-like lactoylglutathione lyase family enzyme
MLTRTSILLGLAVCVCAWTNSATAQAWDHVHLTVSDTEAAAVWYAKHFGGKVTKSGPFDAVWFGTNLMKFRGGRGEILGSDGSITDHIAFSVEDVEGKAAALGEDGAEVPAANRRKPGFRYATDPWGTKIELLDDEDLRGFHHVLLKSTRPRATVEWYTSVFGGEAAKFKDAISINAIRYGDMYLFVQKSLRPVASTKNRSVDHLGWQFKDFDAIIKKLKGLGVKFIVEPNKSGDHMMAFIESPGGVKIEIVEDVR